MRYGTWAAIACAALAVTGCGTSGGAHNRPEPVRALLSADTLMFVSFDADGDFNVTMAEIEAGIPREFARADSNADGSIGPIEFQNWSNVVLGGGQLAPYRLDFDRNVDNVITNEEFRNEILARAREYDSDENGSVSRAEFIRTLNQTRPARQRVQPPEIGPDARH